MGAEVEFEAAMAVRRSLPIGVDDDVEYEVARAVLAAVVPRIEQRVIDRLAGTENPYAVHRTRDDDGKQIHYLHRGDPADGESGIAHRAWSEGAACGVAAERERCPLCNHEWRRHDPEDGRCDCHSETIIGPCQCGRDLTRLCRSIRTGLVFSRRAVIGSWGISLRKFPLILQLW